MRGVLSDGLKEIGRKFKRARLARRMAEVDRTRASRLAALGRRAWDVRLASPALDEFAERISATETRARGVTSKLSEVDEQRKALEAGREEQIRRFAALEADVAKQKAPVDADLTGRRAAAAQAQHAVDESKRRLAAIAASQKALDEETQRPPADSATIAAQREALAREKEEIDKGFGALNEAVTAAAAEVDRVSRQAQQLQAQIDRIAAERRQALGEIDQALAQIRRSGDAARAEGRTVEGQQATHFEELGARLLASGVEAPEITDAAAAVHAAAAQRAEIAAAIEALTAESKAMPPGTMPKFYAVVAAAALVLVVVMGRRGAPDHTPPVPLPTSPVRAEVAPEGQTIDLPGVASVIFPEFAFNTQTVTVSVSATTSGQTAAEFRVTARIFSPGPRLPYEVRINTGGAMPQQPVTARLVLPETFVSAQPPDKEIKALAQIFEDGGEDLLDSFELMESRLDVARRLIDVRLPPQAFTNRRGTQGSFEAIVTLASIRTRLPARRSDQPGMIASVPIAGWLDWIRDILEKKPPCQRKPCDLSPPLTPAKRPTSPFNEGKNHYGTDYPVTSPATGYSGYQAVSPVAAGIVIAVGWDKRDLSEPDPRSKLMVKGWGRYVLIEHCDGSMSLYAHLVENSTSHLKVGQHVSTTDIIGQADNTGGSTGPHLHMEYYIPGQGGKNTYVDPDLCLRYLR